MFEDEQQAALKNLLEAKQEAEAKTGGKTLSFRQQKRLWQQRDPNFLAHLYMGVTKPATSRLEQYEKHQFWTEVLPKYLGAK